MSRQLALEGLDHRFAWSDEYFTCRLPIRVCRLRTQSHFRGYLTIESLDDSLAQLGYSYSFVC